MDLTGTTTVALFCFGMTGGCAMAIFDMIRDGDWVSSIAAVFLSCIASIFPMVGIMIILDYLGRG